jgi:hypothetical protein
VLNHVLVIGRPGPIHKQPLLAVALKMVPMQLPCILPCRRSPCNTSSLVSMIQPLMARTSGHRANSMSPDASCKTMRSSESAGIMSADSADPGPASEQHSRSRSSISGAIRGLRRSAPSIEICELPAWCVRPHHLGFESNFVFSLPASGRPRTQNVPPRAHEYKELVALL